MLIALPLGTEQSVKSLYTSKDTVEDEAFYHCTSRCIRISAATGVPLRNDHVHALHALLPASTLDLVYLNLWYSFPTGNCVQQQRLDSMKQAQKLA
jgi:hypothetical protein